MEWYYRDRKLWESQLRSKHNKCLIGVWWCFSIPKSPDKWALARWIFDLVTSGYLPMEGEVLSSGFHLSRMGTR